MADNILTKKTGGISVIDASIIALTKSLAVDGLITPLLSRFTGGNALLNGVVKGVTAGIIGSAFKGKTGGMVATATLISAGDDIVGSFFGAKKSAVNQGATTSRDDSFGQSNKTPSQEVFI